MQVSTKIGNFIVNFHCNKDYHKQEGYMCSNADNYWIKESRLNYEFTA